MESEKPKEQQVNPSLHNAKGIYIAILNQGHIRPELAHLIVEMTHQTKYRLFISYPAEKPIAYNRNKIIQDFLSKPEYDYLLMIDSDIVPPLNILNLADHQVDIVTPVMFAFNGHAVIPLVMEEIPVEERDDPHKPYKVKNFTGNEGLVEVDVTGSGCMLIKREVVEALENEQPFCNIYDEKGIKTRGLDFSFCEKAKLKGFKSYVHLDFIASHWVTMDLKIIYKAMIDKQEITLAKLK